MIWFKILLLDISIVISVNALDGQVSGFAFAHTVYIRNFITRGGNIPETPFIKGNLNTERYSGNHEKKIAHIYVNCQLTSF